MKKTTGIIAAPITAAILLFIALSSCSGPFKDPGMMDTDRGSMSNGGDGDSGGGSGGSGGGGGGSSSGGSGKYGILTFSDGVPGYYYSQYLLSDVYIIENKTNTSKSDWKDNAKIVARYNYFFDDLEVTSTTLRLSVPDKSLTVGDYYGSSFSDKIWKGSGTYAIYVSYSGEKILKDVSFINGCATVRWSKFIDLDKGSEGGSSNTSAITYTATPDSTTNTTFIELDFNKAVSGLTASDITITNGTGSVTKGALTGSGLSWWLGITVTTAGNITVKITKSGIESGSKTVAVAKESSSAAGTLTFTDGVPKLASSTSFSGDVFIIDNSTNTSTSGWESAKIVAHFNEFFNDQKKTSTTLRLSVPHRSLTVGNHSDVSTYDEVWTGSGTYAIYVYYQEYYGYYMGYQPYPVERILKDVTFTNGCATVKWNNFADVIIGLH